MPQIIQETSREAPASAFRLFTIGRVLRISIGVLAGMVTSVALAITISL
ncbi:MAG: hypothetical protein JKY20_05075 [Alphaproteobacteria bacterium]|nr:hypothetical protein [Alphaproteobacteria bacterium]